MIKHSRAVYLKVSKNNITFVTSLVYYSKFTSRDVFSFLLFDSHKKHAGKTVSMLLLCEDILFIGEQCYKIVKGEKNG